MALFRRIRNWIMGANCGIHVNLLVEHRRADGTLVSRQQKKNIVVNAGLNWLRGLVGNAGTAVQLMISLSSNVSAPAAGDLDLGATIHIANGLARALSTYGAGGTGVFTHSKTFTCSSGPQTVASVGLCYADAADSILAGVAITSATLQTNDTLAVTWTCTFSSV